MVPFGWLVGRVGLSLCVPFGLKSKQDGYIHPSSPQPLQPPSLFLCAHLPQTQPAKGRRQTTARYCSRSWAALSLEVIKTDASRFSFFPSSSFPSPPHPPPSIATAQRRRRKEHIPEWAGQSSAAEAIVLKKNAGKEKRATMCRDPHTQPPHSALLTPTDPNGPLRKISGS